MEHSDEGVRGGVNADHQYVLALRLTFTARSDESARDFIQRLLPSLEISMAPYRRLVLGYGFDEDYTALDANGDKRTFGFCDTSTASIERRQRALPPSRFEIELGIQHEANSDREAQSDVLRYTKAVQDALTPFAANEPAVEPISLICFEYEEERAVGLFAALGGTTIESDLEINDALNL